MSDVRQPPQPDETRVPVETFVEVAIVVDGREWRARWPARDHLSIDVREVWSSERGPRARYGHGAAFSWADSDVWAAAERALVDDMPDGPAAVPVVLREALETVASMAMADERMRHPLLCVEAPPTASPVANLLQRTAALAIAHLDDPEGTPGRVLALMRGFTDGDGAAAEQMADVFAELKAAIEAAVMLEPETERRTGDIHALRVTEPHEDVTRAWRRGEVRDAAVIVLPLRHDGETHEQLVARARAELAEERAEALPLEKRIAAVAAEVPPEMWDALPTDLSQRVDEYLYGDAGADTQVIDPTVAEDLARAGARVVQADPLVQFFDAVAAAGEPWDRESEVGP